MAYEHKENSGNMFENSHKVEGGPQPDFKGTINVDGTVWQIAGWWRETKTGNRMLSLRVSEDRQYGQRSYRQTSKDEREPF